MKVKQPLQQMIVWRSEGKQLLHTYIDIIKDELNVKEVVFTEDLSQYEATVFKLNFKTAGAAFGKMVNSVKDYVNQMPDREKKSLLDDGQLEIDVKGQTVTLLKEHINVEYVVSTGFEMAGDQQLKVMLDIKLTPQLVEEGQVRELIRAIQDTRKKLDLPVEMYISLDISATEESKEIIERFEGLIKENVLVHQISFDMLNDSEQHIEVKIGDEIVKVSFRY
jgi:isoleucyl-tRNA synthetase